MSQENVEVVRRCYELMTNRDFSAFPEVAHPDLVFDLSRNVFNPGVYRGLDGVRRFFEQVDEMWDGFEARPEEFINGGDHVVAAVRISGRGRGGVEVEMQIFAVWMLREGKVVRVTGGYRERGEALEAAGLSE
ncbi:MAG: nuclear transport factor 2 family protein [Actinomycetota bacterium]